jgi:hypothetical protein
VSDLELLTYKQVRAIFKWKSNRTVRDRVRAGLLVRVRVGGSSNSWRITKSSVESMQRLMASVADENEYLRRARAQSLRERKGLLPNPTDDVLLDCEQIIKNAYSHRGGKLPDVAQEHVDTYVAPKPVRRMSTFSQVPGF